MKYRPYNPKSDRLPELPKGIKVVYYQKEANLNIIYGEDKTHRYTIEWDGFSKNPDTISYAPKTG